MGKRSPKPRLGADRRAHAPAIDDAAPVAALEAAAQAVAASDSAAALMAIKAGIAEISDLALLLTIKARIEKFSGRPQDASREQLEAFVAFVLEKSAQLPSAVSMGNILAESVLAIRDMQSAPQPGTGGQPNAATSR